MPETMILDPCCGSRMMWFDKNNPATTFGDNRNESHVLCDGRVLNISPDVQMDFTDIPFADNTFHLVAFDPPHLIRAGQKSWLRKKYGILNADWEDDIRKGFLECMRVLKPHGTLIFKWNETQVKTCELLKVLPQKPLFGHVTSNRGHTIWMTFMKEKR